MKNLIILVLFLTIIISVRGMQTFSQNIFPMDEKTGEIVYSENVNADSVSARELYGRASKWFAKTFMDAPDVIQLADKEAGKIIGKGFFEAICPRTKAVVSIYFTAEIQTKERKYKYVLSDFSCIQVFFTGEKTTLDLKSPSVWKNTVSQELFDDDWLNTKKDASARMLVLIDGLKKTMEANSDN
jgi:hypothetical protein